MTHEEWTIITLAVYGLAAIGVVSLIGWLWLGWVIDRNGYHYEMFWSDEDCGFIAIIPELPGCTAFGETRSEALLELEDAKTSWLEAFRNIHSQAQVDRNSHGSKAG